MSRGIDNVACGRMAAEALIRRRHRRVAFLGGPERATSTQDRAAGFLDALASHPAITATVSYATDSTFDAGRAAMARLLAASPAEAYFCGDDLPALGAVAAIAEAGLSVPRDIGLVGLNDKEMAGWPTIGLTTIRQPVADLIDAAIDLVVVTILDPDHPVESRLFPCLIINRGTLRAPS